MRVPRSGSTSLAFYFFKSGLIADTDVYTLEGGFSSWEEYDKFNIDNGLDYFKLPRKLFGLDSLETVQRKFDDARAKSAVAADMPCVASIRHPLHWCGSLFYYTKERREALLAANNGVLTEYQQKNFDNYGDPNEAWDYGKDVANRDIVQTSLDAQFSYFPDHAEVFNTENIHEHASKFILDKGGKVESRIQFRLNPVEHLTSYLAEMTEGRKKEILDFYAKDFELWEKAYAVYN